MHNLDEPQIGYLGCGPKCNRSPGKTQDTESGEMPRSMRSQSQSRICSLHCSTSLSRCSTTILPRVKFVDLWHSEIPVRGGGSINFPQSLHIGSLEFPIFSVFLDPVQLFYASEILTRLRSTCSFDPSLVSYPVSLGMSPLDDMMTTSVRPFSSRERSY